MLSDQKMTVFIHQPLPTSESRSVLGVYSMAVSNLVRCNTGAHRQLRFAMNSGPHLLHTRFCVNLMVYAVLCYALLA